MEKRLWHSSDHDSAMEDVEEMEADEYGDESFEDQSDPIGSEHAALQSCEPLVSNAALDGLTQSRHSAGCSHRDQDQDEDQDEYSQDSFEHEQEDDEDDYAPDFDAPDDAVDQPQLQQEEPNYQSNIENEDLEVTEDEWTPLIGPNDWFFKKILHLKLSKRLESSQRSTPLSVPTGCRRGNQWRSLSSCQVDALVNRLKSLKNSPQQGKEPTAINTKSWPPWVVSSPEQQEVPTSVHERALVHRFVNVLLAQQQGFESELSSAVTHMSGTAIPMDCQQPFASHYNDSISSDKGIDVDMDMDQSAECTTNTGLHRKLHRSRGGEGALSTFCSVKKQKLLEEQLCTSTRLDNQRIESHIGHQEFLSQMLKDQREFVNEFNSASTMASCSPSSSSSYKRSQESGTGEENVELLAKWQCFHSKALREQAQRVLNPSNRSCHCRNHRSTAAS